MQPKTTGVETLARCHDEPAVSFAPAKSLAWAMPPEPLTPMIGEIELLERIFSKAKPKHYTSHYEKLAARRCELETLVQATPGHSLTAIIWKLDKLVGDIRENRDTTHAALLRATEAILDDLIRYSCVEGAG